MAALGEGGGTPNSDVPPPWKSKGIQESAASSGLPMAFAKAREYCWENVRVDVGCHHTQ